MDKNILNRQSQHWETNFSNKPEMFGLEPSLPAKKALNIFKKKKKNFKLPFPLMNIINGGAHANNGLKIQEFMIRPDSAKNFTDAIEKCFLVIQNLKKYFIG